MDSGYVLLIEKEEMWAKMLMQVLEDNGIPCTALPVNGAGLVMKTFMQERLKVYVPAEKMHEATALLEKERKEKSEKVKKNKPAEKEAEKDAMRSFEVDDFFAHALDRSYGKKDAK